MSLKNVLYYGEETSPPEQIPLNAGPLSLAFESGDLRYIRLGENEILRRLYVAVRDPNWGTVPTEITNLSLKKSDRDFRISYDAMSQQGEIQFRWSADIAGERDGTIVFRMKGEALTTFRRNRIGFCILHPVKECAGRRCSVEKVDGSVETGLFPQFIAPDQPFMDIRALSHEVIPGVSVEIRFDGDVFEMEDQRNWCDASFKTYCTPLRLPFPVEVRSGTVIQQSVKISLSVPILVPAARGEGNTVTFSVGASSCPVPRLGLGVGSRAEPLSPIERPRLKTLNLSHLRADLDLSQGEYQLALERAALEANSLGVPLEAAIFLSDSADRELQDLTAMLHRVKPRVCRWLIFHRNEKSTRGKWISRARHSLLPYDPAAEIVSGTNAYFAELNRARPEVQLLDGVCFSINPQVHAFDNDSLVENLAAQAHAVESARRFAGNLPIVVTPVTLKPRFNPDATSEESGCRPGQMPPDVDPRQMSLFGAGWTLGSLKYIAESGVSSVTYYETAGCRGVMGTEKESLPPGQFRSFPGSVFPVYHVLADFGEFMGGEVLRSRSSSPLQVDGLILTKGDRARILLANLGPREMRVRLQGLPFSRPRVWLKQLDETNAADAMNSPESFREKPGVLHEIAQHCLEIDLLPYATARID
jgi:D-apionolactonase